MGLLDLISGFAEAGHQHATNLLNMEHEDAVQKSRLFAEMAQNPNLPPEAQDWLAKGAFAVFDKKAKKQYDIKNGQIQIPVEVLKRNPFKQGGSIPGVAPQDVAAPQSSPEGTGPRMANIGGAQIPIPAMPGQSVPQPNSTLAGTGGRIEAPVAPTMTQTVQQSPFQGRSLEENAVLRKQAQDEALAQAVALERAKQNVQDDPAAIEADQRRNMIPVPPILQKEFGVGAMAPAATVASLTQMHNDATVAPPTPPRPSLPSIAAEYEYAVSHGYKGTFEQYQDEDANRKRPMPTAAEREGIASSPDKPEVQALAKNLLNYAIPWPTGVAASKPDFLAAQQLASEMDPTWRASEYATRLSTMKDFKSGPTSKGLTALNTVIGHLGSMAESAKALNNSNWSTHYNDLANYIASATGDPRVKKFNQDKAAVIDEMTKAFRGTGGNEADIKRWEESMGSSNSPAQFDSVIKGAVELLASRIAAVQDQYERTFEKPPSFQMLGPKAQATLKKLGIDPGTIVGSGTAGAPTPPPGMATHVEIINGKNYNVNDKGIVVSEAK